MLRADPSRRTPQIAAKPGLNRAWLARAYRAVAGEGLRDTARRYRTERAIRLLGASALPIAQVAAQTGFADRSHLNRALKALTGRTPVQVRAEAG
ncbi:MAG TPA: AraC family transcriptional regulator [Rhizomicrobium sp.]|nr:AraC family transcriptional regulator [Rhizomicrobium sp.]